MLGRLVKEIWKGKVKKVRRGARGRQENHYLHLTKKGNNVIDLASWQISCPKPIIWVDRQNTTLEGTPRRLIPLEHTTMTHIFFGAFFYDALHYLRFSDSSHSGEQQAMSSNDELLDLELFLIKGHFLTALGSGGHGRGDVLLSIYFLTTRGPGGHCRGVCFTFRFFLLFFSFSSCR